MKKPNHILVGKSLLLNINHIVSANLDAKDNDDKPCIKIQLDNGTTWTIWANLRRSKEVLRSIPLFNEKLVLIEDIKNTVLVSRPTILKKKLTDILNQ